MRGKIIVKEYGQLVNCIIEDVDVIVEPRALVSGNMIRGGAVKTIQCEVMMTKEFERCDNCKERFDCWTKKWLD